MTLVVELRPKNKRTRMMVAVTAISMQQTSVVALNMLPPIGADEDLLLDGSCHRQPGASRLSCQIRLSGEMEGLRLTIAPAE